MATLVRFVVRPASRFGRGTQMATADLHMWISANTLESTAKDAEGTENWIFVNRKQI
jgi:hypothetical protein